MKTTIYNKKKIFGLFMLSCAINSVTPIISFSADITPGAGETVTVTGINNEERIIATGDDVTVILNAGSKLKITDNYPTISLHNNSTVTLNTGSTIENISEDTKAAAISISNNDDTQYGINSVSLNAADIITSSSGYGPYAKGIDIKGGYYNGGEAIVHLDNNSSISATSTLPYTPGRVGLSKSYGINVGSSFAEPLNITIDLLNNSSLLSIAKSYGDTYGEARSYGINSISDNNIGITLSSSNINSTAIASSVTNDEYTNTNAKARGIYAVANGNITISLDNKSQIIASSTGSAFADGGESSALAYGLFLESTSTTGTQNSVTLNNSSIIAEASAEGSSASAKAAGIKINGFQSVVITLANGAGISASANTLSTSANNSIGYGILVDENATAKIKTDATSSIHGSTYAIYGIDGDDDGGSTTVENAGLISGRLHVSTLDNSPTGILQLNNPDNEDFYFTISGIATLANGTTFTFNPNDDFATLKQVGPGNSVSYNVLSAGTGDWIQSGLNLTASSNYTSPMFSLAWDEASDATHLIATAAFLTPEQAGLTRNGTEAFYAAYKDDLFTFYGSPEEWYPDVSGANLMGITQFIDSSRTNISKRLREVESGINSGDYTSARGVWASARYTDANQDRRDDVEGFDLETSSLTVGYDHQLADSLAAMGAAFSYGTTDAETDFSHRDLDMTDYLLTVYGNYDANTWFVEGQLSYGWGDADSDRTVSGINLSSSYDSNVYYARVAAGLKYAYNGWQVLPQSSFDYSHVEFDGYTEKGGGMALDVDSQDYDIANIGFGLQMLKTYTWQNKILLIPEAGAMVYYDLVGDEIEATSTFVNGSTPFVSKGADQDRTTYDLSLGLTLGEVESDLSFKVGYEYIAREDFDSHNFSAKLRYEF